MENQIKQDLKAAMLNKQELEVSTLRMLSSELTYLKVQKGLKNSDELLEDADVVSVVQKELKKRKEAAEGFRKGGREDEAQKEEAEAKVLEKYLPAQLGDEELLKIVNQAITETGATSMSDMGKVIGLVKGQVGQSADGGRISNLVRERLNV